MAVFFTVMNLEQMDPVAFGLGPLDARRTMATSITLLPFAPDRRLRACGWLSGSSRRRCFTRLVYAGMFSPACG
jgi:hypothetical protein